MRPVGVSLAALSGAVWGVAFWSWGLPVPIPLRAFGTVLLLSAMSASSLAGTLAAGVFALGMGASSALLLAIGGQLFVDWWGLVPAAALLGGLGLVAAALMRDSAS